MSVEAPPGFALDKACRAASHCLLPARSLRNGAGMRVCLLAIRTRGDVQPYVALDLSLKSAGFGVSIAATADFEAQRGTRRERVKAAVLVKFESAAREQVCVGRKSGDPGSVRSLPLFADGYGPVALKDRDGLLNPLARREVRGGVDCQRPGPLRLPQNKGGLSRTMAHKVDLRVA
jgi:hypothetical protein